MAIMKIPYTNFHGENQDWMIETIKKLIQEWAEYDNHLQQQYDAFVSEVNTNINAFEAASERAFQDLKDYVNNYFDNLDVQEAIDHKLDEMIDSGQWDQILEQYFSDLTREVEEALQRQNHAIADQNLRFDAQDAAIETLQTEMANFIQNMGPHTATLRTSETLWSGSINQDTDNLELSDLLSNYDFVEVYVNFANRTCVQRFDVPRFSSTTGASVLTMNLANEVTITPAGLALGELNIKVNEELEGDVFNTLKISFNYWHWTGEETDDSTQSTINNSFRLVRIDGIKYQDSGAVQDAELIDLRVAYNDETYATAGDAIRTVETDFNDRIEDLENDVTLLNQHVEDFPTGLVYRVPDAPLYDPNKPPLYCLTVELTGPDHDIPHYSWMDWGTWKNWM